MNRRQASEIKFPRAAEMPQPENCLPCKFEFKPQHAQKKARVMEVIHNPSAAEADTGLKIPGGQSRRNSF